jgi:hypothetical protein
VNDASVVKDFYSITLPDGTRSDAWEQRLSEVEDSVAPRLRALATSDAWFVADEDRAEVALWVALQYLRGRDNRRLMAHTKALMLRLQVGMGGIAYLHHAISQAVGREVPMDVAERVWEDVHRVGGPTVQVSSEEHIATITSAAGDSTVYLASQPWQRVRFDRRTLITNDSPVGLLPSSDHPPFLGIGLKNAGAITIALDRRTILMINAEAPGDTELPPSTLFARTHNASVLFGAERFVYANPEDAHLYEELAGAPRGLRPFQEPHNIADFANRDRPLDSVLEQNELHDPVADPGALIANYTWPIPGYLPPEGLGI